VSFVVLAVAVGVGLRLCSFSPFWLDEAQTVQFARVPLHDLHAALRTDGAPPLYYALLHFWIKMFGTGVWAVRSMSMLASLVCLPVIWRVARRLGGSRELAAVVLVLLATSPWAIRYAGEARMYSLVVLEVLLGILALERLRRCADKRSLGAVGLSTAALLLTHYWAIWLLANVAGGLAFVAWRRPEERRFVIRAGLAAGCGVLAFLPWVPTMLYQSRHTGAPWALTPDLGSVAELPMDWFGGSGPAGTCASLVVIPLLVVAVFGRRTAGGALLFAGRPGRRAGLLGSLILSTLLTALTAAVATHSTVAPRYTAVVVPLVMLLMGVGVTRLPRKVGHAVLAILVSIGVAGGITVATTPHTQAGQIAGILNQDAGYGDLVVYCPDQLAPAIETRLHVLGVTRIELPAEKNPYVIDWTDYLSRLAGFNAQATARSITSYLKTQADAAVWLVSAWGYDTHTAVCGPLRDRLTAALGPPVLMHDSDAPGIEKAALERFGAPKH
jgi:hypothetical protein